MVIRVCSLGLLLALTHSPTKSDQPPAAAPAGAQEFTVELSVLDKNHPFQVPKIRVHDGGTASVRDLTESRQVVGQRVVDGRKVPIIRVFSEGTSVEATVTALDADEVLLELWLEMKSFDVDDTAEGSAGVRVYNLMRHVTKRVKLGSRTTAEIGGLKLAIVVNAAN